MALLLDTHAIVWMALGSRRMSADARLAIEDIRNPLFVSAVIAWEYAELNRRGRFGNDLPLARVLDDLGATILDFPADAWSLATTLPPLHRDPVDRMLVAHAIHAGLTIVTADATIRTYPVAALW